MPFPFSYTGISRPQEHVSRDEVFGKLSRALMVEGAHDVQRVGEAIEFRGITGQGHTSPLTNIERGKIWIHDGGATPTLSYTIAIERWGFVVPLVVILLSLILLAAGDAQFGVFAVFGAAFVAAACVNSLAIRIRFPRWLRRALAEP